MQCFKIMSGRGINPCRCWWVARVAPWPNQTTDWHAHGQCGPSMRACDHYTASTLIGGRDGLVQVRFTLCLRDQRSICMQDGCKVHLDSYMASNGSCIKVTWTFPKNHLLEVGLTQHGRPRHYVDLFYIIMCEDMLK